ncbi:MULTISPECIES: hypothetical protein [Pseudomonas]|uniref:DUF3077 domain-containing protein n=1 Tax=Pseudomonas sp. Hg7Tf TaxID=3236988 RepID=A0AB39HZL3_9PSED|nr:MULTISPECIES: hypothetical protein [unclassified Pseudomonas]KJK09112.1 hypothetical protein UB47_05295 [Pseudomonas sp. 5]MDH2560129.1 hypothetical protein [Pseudomonas sp. Hg5Tf]
MKKIVPDPPTPFTTPYFSIHSDLIPPDSLAYASELLRGIHETTDEFCRVHANEPGQGMLVNVLYSAEMARALVEHALSRLQGMDRGAMT